MSDKISDHLLKLPPDIDFTEDAIHPKKITYITNSTKLHQSV